MQLWISSSKQYAPTTRLRLRSWTGLCPEFVALARAGKLQVQPVGPWVQRGLAACIAWERPCRDAAWALALTDRQAAYFACLTEHGSRWVLELRKNCCRFLRRLRTALAASMPAAEGAWSRVTQAEV